MLKAHWLAMLIVGALVSAPAVASDPPLSETSFTTQQDNDITPVKFRSLSLLTVAQTQQARLFIGVNSRGVLGLHFGALPRHGNRPTRELRSP